MILFFSLFQQHRENPVQMEEGMKTGEDDQSLDLGAIQTNNDHIVESEKLGRVECRIASSMPREGSVTKEETMFSLWASLLFGEKGISKLTHKLNTFLLFLSWSTIKIPLRIFLSTV